MHVPADETTESRQTTEGEAREGSPAESRDQNRETTTSKPSGWILICGAHKHPQRFAETLFDRGQ